MNRQHLLERKASYEAKKVELMNNDYAEEKAIELAKAKEEIDKKYEQIKAQDCQKVDHYLELLDVLIEDATKEEVAAMSAQVTETEVES